MSDIKRYEKELAERLKKLSSPNKVQVWKKIEDLLDREDKDGIVIPPLPPSNGSNILWGLLLLLFLTCASWYFIHLKKSVNAEEGDNKNEPIANTDHPLKNMAAGDDKSNTSTLPVNDAKKINDSAQSLNEKNNITNESLKNSDASFAKNKIPVTTSNSIEIKGAEKNSTTAYSSKSNRIEEHSGNNDFADNIQPANNKKHFFKKPALTKKAKAKFSTIDVTTRDIISDKLKVTEEPTATDTGKVITAVDNKPVTIAATDTFARKDSSKAKPAVSTPKTDTTAVKKTNDEKKKKLYVTTGLAVQQTIGLYYNTVYADNGLNTTVITDYLPSVYVRLYNRKKWFIQTEFKYVAPQNIEEFIYKVNVVTPPFKDIVTSYTLKKMRYQQLSAGFHYFIVPNLSIGTGIIYNIFSGADIQKDAHEKQYGSANDVLLGSENITDKEDPGFSGHIKNNFQWLLETQYKWRHLSIGLRYATGLQPYMEYTDPFSGLPVSKKSDALNLFIRYELWRKKNN